jgi:hypothetical protein
MNARRRPHQQRESVRGFMSQELNRNLFPREGYVFIDRDGTKHKSDSWRNLEQKIIEYRQRNGMPVGDVLGEITTQACAKQPSICRDPNPGPIPPQGLGAMTFTQHVLHWAIHLLGLKRLNKVPRVPDDVPPPSVDLQLARWQSSARFARRVTSLKNTKKALLDGEYLSIRDLRDVERSQKTRASLFTLSSLRLSPRTILNSQVIAGEGIRCVFRIF